MAMGPDGMPVKVAGQRRPNPKMGGGYVDRGAREAAMGGLKRPMARPMGAPPMPSQMGMGSPRIAPINTPEMAGGGIAPGGATLPPQPQAPPMQQQAAAPTPDMAMRPGGIGSPRIAPISLPEAQQQQQPQVQSAVPPPPAPPPVMGATAQPGMAQAGLQTALAGGAGGMPPPALKMGMPPPNPGMAQAGQMQAPGAPVMRPPMKAGMATGAAPGGAMPARPINYAAGLATAQRPAV